MRVAERMCTQTYINDVTNKIDVVNNYKWRPYLPLWILIYSVDHYRYLEELADGH